MEKVLMGYIPGKAILFFREKNSKWSVRGKAKGGINFAINGVYNSLSDCEDAVKRFLNA